MRRESGFENTRDISIDPALTDAARPFSIGVAGLDDFAELAKDISEVEKKILGLRRGGDWQAAIDATLRSSTESHAVRHPFSPGILIFGMTNIAPLGAGLIWMMQSAAFEAAAGAAGAEYLFKLRRVCRMYVESRRAAYGTVFNFVSGDRADKIRWLKQMEFEFYPAVGLKNTGMLMFGAGEDLKWLAQSAEVWDAFFPPADVV